MRTPGASRTRDALEAVRHAPSVLVGLDRLDALVASVREDGDAALPVLRAAVDGDDHLVAIAAVHGAAGSTATARALVAPLLTSPVPFLREHAAWVLGRCDALADAVQPLRAVRGQGGLPGALAEATLEAWGVIEVADGDPVTVPPAPRPSTGGLTVAQLFLHADIDGSLRYAGKGDTGGIATLLVQLGDALVADPRVARVLTLSRSHHDLDRRPDDPLAPGHHYLGVPLPGPVRHAADTWSLRSEVRRGIRRALRSAGPVDVLHLRMADVGSWAAAQVARELAIPTVLTLAPDPHALIAAREATGELTRATFGAVDHAEHLVFRVRLLRALAAEAAHLVVLPRPELGRDLRQLLHVDPTQETQRLSVVPEGIDVRPLDRAATQVRRSVRGRAVAPATSEALSSLDTLLRRLPPARRGLPLAITVGRLHPVKGIATLVAAWADDGVLHARCNLLVVGGDLDRPTDDEAAQLALVDAVLPLTDAARHGLLLAGHRPNGTVATWLAAVAQGRPGLSAPDGVYVSASLKEEFGIAILEAMASGLVVVAPGAGGPATYVDHGVSGLLVDTTCPTSLAGGVRAALLLAAAPGAAARAERARALVAERFGITTMASSLAAVYSKVHHDAARHQS